MKYLLSILTLISIITCDLITTKPRDIIVNKDIDRKLLDRLIELNLVNNNDTILGLWYSITDELNAKSESYTLFTSKKFLRYFQFEDKEAKIEEIPIDKILKINRTLDPIDTNRILIRIRQLDTILYNDREQKEFIIYDDFDFRPPYDTKFSQQEKFYQLLEKIWKSNHNYKDLIEKYYKFFNEDGSKIITEEIRIERSKLQALKKELEKLSVNIIDQDDNIIVYFNNVIISITYDFIDLEYTVFKKITEKSYKDTIDIMIIDVAIYPIFKYGEIELPYTERGYTINSVDKSYEKTTEDIIDKYFE